MDNLHIKNDNPVKKSPESVRTQKSLTKIKGVQPDEDLLESEVRYRRLFETAKDGILILDFETGDIIDANPYLSKLIGFPLREILGKKLWEIGIFSNKEESELAYAAMKTNGYLRFEDMPVQSPNRQITDVEFTSNVYPENQKKVIQCTIRDITKRIKAEIALKKSEKDQKKQNQEFAVLNKEYSIQNEELKENISTIQHINNDLIIAKNKAEESDKLKTAFMCSISHEIRTPMNAIVGFSNLLLHPELPKDKLERYIQIINTSSQQLLSVISDIMEISKMESGQYSVDIKLVNINKLMNELFDSYKKLINFQKVRLTYLSDCSEEQILVKTDGGRIRQVICNLLNNAIKFTSEGEIQFGYSIHENFLEFYVSDSGIGIAPENLELIFRPFRHVDATREKLNAGNGLGLSISKALVEKLGGTIRVNSEPEVGSSFVFTIPYIQETLVPVAKTAETWTQNSDH